MRNVFYLALILPLPFILDGQHTAVWVPARVVNVEYPLLGLQSRTSGSVRIQCDIASDGSVESAKILSGSRLLGEAVIQRIGEWRFRPDSATTSPPSPATVK